MPSMPVYRYCRSETATFVSSLLLLLVSVNPHVRGQEPNRQPLAAVLGIDFGFDKIVASASFPNGTVRYIDKVDTTNEYEKLVRQYLNSENAFWRHRVENSPGSAALFPQSDLPVQCPLDDENYKIITDVFESLQPKLKQLRSRAELKLGFKLTNVPTVATSLLGYEYCYERAVTEIIFRVLSAVPFDDGDRDQIHTVSMSERAYETRNSFFTRVAMSRADILTLELLKLRPLWSPSNAESRVIKISYTNLSDITPTLSPSSHKASDRCLQTAIQLIIENFLRYFRLNGGNERGLLAGYDYKPVEFNHFDIILEGNLNQANRYWLDLETILEKTIDFWRGTIFDWINPEHVRSISAAMYYWESPDSVNWHEHLACRLVKIVGPDNITRKEERCFFPEEALSMKGIDWSPGVGPFGFENLDDYNAGFEGLDTEPIPEFEKYRVTMEGYHLQNIIEDEAQLRRSGQVSWEETEDDDL